MTVPQLLRPRLWRRPRLGIRLDWICAAIQEQPHQFGASPPACPPKRSRVEHFISNVKHRTMIEQQSCESCALCFIHIAVPGGSKVKRRRTKGLRRSGRSRAAAAVRAAEVSFMLGLDCVPMPRMGWIMYQCHLV